MLRRALAAAIVVLLVLHGIAHSPSQLLWACHLASIATAIGLVFGLPRLVAVCLVFQTGEGIPAYVIDGVVAGDTSLVSILLHTLPIGSAAWALWGRPLPRGILIPALLVHPGAMVAAYALADPRLNVMLVHVPYGPTQAWFPALWMSWLANVALSVVCVAAGWLAVQLVWKRWA